MLNEFQDTNISIITISVCGFQWEQQTIMFADKFDVKTGSEPRQFFYEHGSERGFVCFSFWVGYLTAKRAVKMHAWDDLANHFSPKMVLYLLT